MPILEPLEMLKIFKFVNFDREICLICIYASARG